MYIYIYIEKSEEAVVSGLFYANKLLLARDLVARFFSFLKSVEEEDGIYLVG